MTDREGAPRPFPLETVPSGISAPLYADGQVVHAADLRLDRTSHDEELRRMRRLLHGWGVVAGLVAEKDGTSLVVGRGYGVCPSGAEVLLPRDVVIADLPQKMADACRPAPGRDCGLEAEQPDGGDGVLEAWLVIRPVETQTAPRASLRDGCAHPGNQLAPTRACVDDVLALTCCLPDGHEREHLDCATARDYLTGRRHLPVPDRIPEDDILVLAALTWNEGALEVTLEPRRPLLPVSVLQDIVWACADKEAPGGGEAPEPHGEEGEDRPPLIRIPQPGLNRLDWVNTLRLARERAQLIPVPGKPDPLGPVARDEAIKVLVAAGLSTTKVLSTEAADIVELTGLSRDLVDAVKGQLTSVSQHVGRLRF